MIQDIVGTGVLFRDHVPEHLARSGAIGVVPNPLRWFDEVQKQFNQNAYDKSGCTYTADMTIASNNWVKDITAADIKRFLDNKHLYGWTGAGMYMDRACDMFCDRMNMLYPEEAWVKKQIDRYTQRAQYLKVGHMLMIGSMIDDPYIEEIKDGKIDKPWGKTGIGHVRCDFLHMVTPTEALCENFLGVLPFNVIDIVALKEIEQANQLYHTCFLIYPSGKMPIEIKYPYMTVAQAEALEKSYPLLFSSSFSESVRAWVDLAQAGEDVYYEFVDFTGMDGVVKMMINLDKYREKEKPL